MKKNKIMNKQNKIRMKIAFFFNFIEMNVTV